MLIGISRETLPGENRVALTPEAAAELIGKGMECAVEAGAGEAAGFGDGAYSERGVEVVAARPALFERADVIVQVQTYGANPQGGGDLELLRTDCTLIGFAEPLEAHDQLEKLARTGVSLFSMELMPRITRAQSMDALSSMATIAGYKAVLLAAGELPRVFPLMMTAAGTLAPARVLVIGAGVAGLQAIATAKRLGAVVMAYDVRPAVREQVESLGAQFVDLGLETADSEDAGGYAKDQGEEFLLRQQAALGEVLAECNVVITTAAVPGMKAPILVTGSMVAGMQPRSVIVDLAAERGGNCELTVPGQNTEAHGVLILGPVNLPASVPYHASQMYAHNVSKFLQHLAGYGEILFDDYDEITQGTLVTRGGRIVHPRVLEAMGRGEDRADETVAVSPSAGEGGERDN